MINNIIIDKKIIKNIIKTIIIFCLTVLFIIQMCIHVHAYNPEVYTLWCGCKRYKKYHQMAKNTENELPKTNKFKTIHKYYNDIITEIKNYYKSLSKLLM